MMKKKTKTPDWLPSLRKALRVKAGKAQAFMRELLGNLGGKDYKAPHAPRGTPARPLSRFAGYERLFKGHRP